MSDNGTPEMLTQARALAVRGWRVLPVNGKVPLLKDWPKLATTDETAIREWWSQYPDANIGLATGQQSNLLVLDIDPANGGDDSLRTLEAQHGALPETVQVLTGGGGHHYYFRHPGNGIGNSAGKLGVGLDIKTDGGQVVAPPSIHPITQRSYEWEACHHPDDIALAEVPPWLLAQLTGTKTQGAPFVVPETIADGQRNDILYKTARSLKAKRLDRASIRAALHVENRIKCEPPLPDWEIEDIVESAWSQADRAAFTQPGPQQNADDAPAPDALLGMGLGAFLALDFPPTIPLIEGLLSNDGGGWISGEEKLGKSYYALEESLCLALGQPVCGRFAVPTRMRVLFLEEEDSPSRTSHRIKQLLRGYGLDPDAPDLRAELNFWFRMSVWNGFTLDDAPHVEQLRLTIEAFRPVVVYLDVLRKLTFRDLNKGDQAGALLKILDVLRREFGVLFRVVAHNRKIQGSFRAGRGSQEIAGSYQLGAWAENSLFFEPIGKTGKVKVQAQRKDGAQTPAFSLRFEAEGPEDNPTLVRLHAEELSTSSAADLLKEQVFEAIGSLPPEEALVSGSPGVSVASIMTVVHKSDRPIRNAVTALVDDGRCLVTGRTTKQKKLYAQITL